MKHKSFEAKKNHHYVWAHYLAQWSDDGKNVWRTTTKRKVNRDSVKSFCVEDYFYSSKEITIEHTKIINYISSFSPINLQELHKSFLEDFLKVQRLRRIYEASDMDDSVAEQALHALKCNMMENLHATHEKEALSVIDVLISGDISILENGDNLIKFIAFFGHQISRTKSFKKTFLLTSFFADKQGEEMLRVHNLIEDCWWFISYMFGINIGWSLYASRNSDKHCLLINRTEKSFITSDQPVINVHLNIKQEKIVPPADDDCDFFLPLSPRTAFMINKSDRFSEGINVISEDVVEEMNEKISLASSIYIVGVDREIVAQYKMNVGARHTMLEHHKLKF